MYAQKRTLEGCGRASTASRQDKKGTMANVWERSNNEVQLLRGSETDNLFSPLHIFKTIW
jgi:hypothetical protein